MFIDSSRLMTLNRLQREIDDPSRTVADKKRAFRLKSKLQKEMKDPLLAHLRERLYLAVKADDKYNIWKITCQIKDYMKEEVPVDIYEKD